MARRSWTRLCWGRPAPMDPAGALVVMDSWTDPRIISWKEFPLPRLKLTTRLRWWRFQSSLLRHYVLPKFRLLQLRWWSSSTGLPSVWSKPGCNPLLRTCRPRRQNFLRWSVNALWLKLNFRSKKKLSRQSDDAHRSWLAIASQPAKLTHKSTW